MEIKNFIRDLFKFAQLQPREVDGRILVKGWCHDSDQHCVWVNEDGTVECAVCGKMTFDEYFDKIYPAFTDKDVFAEWGISLDERVYMYELYFNYWQVQHGQLDQLIEEFSFNYEVTEETRDQMIRGVETYKNACQEQILLANLNRQTKDDGNYFFRGQQISLKQGSKQVAIKEECAWQTDEIETKDINKYFWCWNGGEYERNEFFKAAFPDYNKYNKKVVPNEETLKNLMRLSTTQRQSLIYDVLSQYYPLIEVAESDSEDLMDFCKPLKNQTASDTLMKLRWQNGLAKMVTFGLGITIKGAASMTWCYEVMDAPRMRKYSSVKMTWELWSIAIVNKIKDAINDGLEFAEAWDAVRPVIYCQNKVRLTLADADRQRVYGFINDYLKNGDAAWPQALTGAIGDEYEFIVDFDRDFEIKEQAVMKKEGGMAAFNKEAGCIKVMTRFMEVFPEAKCGDIITTKELKAAGYNPNAIKRLVNHEILENFAWGKYRVIWVQ